MKHKILIVAVLVVSGIAVSERGQRLLTTAAVAQPPQNKAGDVPTFQFDPSWPKVPAKWKLGEGSSIAIDAQDNAWVLQRPLSLPPDQAALAAPPVLEFDPEGNFLQGWGGAGAGYEWPQREHGIFVDYKGYVWIGGNNCPGRKLPGLKPVSDDQLLKFTKTGKFVMQIGHSNKSKGNSDTENLHWPADVFVYPKTNEAFVADGYGNRRVVVFDADTGAFKRMWGAFGKEPVGEDDCPSADTPLAPGQRPVEAGPGPPQFDIVHAVRVSNDGLVYVADRENKRVQVFTLDGKYVTQIVRRTGQSFAGGLAFSPDPGQEFLYVAASSPTWDISVLDRKTLEILYSFPGKGVPGGGHQLTSDSKGNLYAARLGRDPHLQKWVFKELSSAPSP